MQSWYYVEGKVKNASVQNNVCYYYNLWHKYIFLRMFIFFLVLKDKKSHGQDQTNELTWVIALFAFILARENRHEYDM